MTDQELKDLAARIRERQAQAGRPGPPPNSNGNHESQADDSERADERAQAESPGAEANEVDYPWPHSPAAEVYHGLVGEIVRQIGPESEADPVAILAQLLVGFGNMIGRTAHFRVEGDLHFTNLFAVLMGETAKGRKGTSFGRVRRLLEKAEQNWVEKRILSGLSSGEGVIWNVRDPITAREKIKEKGRIVGMQEYESDPGEPDKRLMVQEAEFAVVLKQTERQGNTLSAILRQAWESGNLRTLTKNTPAKATGAHISIIGHITVEELRRYLTTTEAASGFGNRFLWFCVRRSKCLPDGGGLVALERFSHELGRLSEWARTVGQIQRDNGARDLWHSVYPALSEGRPGLHGALSARAEAQTLRLACVYALLDGFDVVKADHLRAALSLWEYSERSIRFAFGDSLGDDVADEILAVLRQRADGMTRTEIRDFFGRNHVASRLSRALGLLQRFKLAHNRREMTAGRPAERWFSGAGATT